VTKKKITRKQLDDEIEGWRGESEEKIVDIVEDDIMSVVSKWTGVPLQRMEQREACQTAQYGEGPQGVCHWSKMRLWS
jgi:ATP-dependent Clp protease ATP-binding subunit ClpA